MMGRTRLPSKSKFKRRKGEEKFDEYAEVKRKVSKTKKRVKALTKLIKVQTQLLKAVVEKADPTSDFDKAISVTRIQESQSEPAEDEEGLDDEGLLRRMERLGTRILKINSESTSADKGLNE